MAALQRGLNLPEAVEALDDAGEFRWRLTNACHAHGGFLKALTGCNCVEIASEKEFQNAFPDCELGAMPPFGNLYDMPVYADASLAEHEEITFSAGTHRELVRMQWEDMLRIVNPTVAELTYHSLVAG